MRLLKRILLGVGVLVVVLIAVAFLLPREAQVTRSVDIAAKPAVIFPIASDLRRFNEWSPWLDLDPATSFTFTGPTDGVGQTLNWVSRDPRIAAGKIVVTRIDPDTLAEMSVTFGRQNNARSWIELAPNGGTTRVTWGFGADTGFNPVARYFGLALDRSIGPDYEKGLAKLKAVSEARNQ